MTRRLLRLVLLTTIMVLAVLPLAGCGRGGAAGDSPPAELTVSAAVSLKDALDDITATYSRSHPGITIHLNYGASGTLKRQVEEGAPVDVFLAAGSAEMDQLAAEGLLATSSRRNLAGNTLVLVIPRDNEQIRDFNDLTKPVISSVALGLPETVPAGKYAKETLEGLGLWQGLQPKLVLARDVRQVLTWVATGNAGAGFVYLSDALAEGRVRVALEVPDQLHSPIVYQAAIPAAAPNPTGAAEYLDYLATPDSRAVLTGYGFRESR